MDQEDMFGIEEESPCAHRHLIPATVASAHCEFFYDPSERGYYLEDSDNFNKILNEYEIPQRLLEKIMNFVNDKLKNSDLKAVVPPEAVFDNKTIMLLRGGTLLFFVFFILSVLTLYLERSYILFLIGVVIFAAGMLAFLLIIIFNGDFRFKRKSKFQLTDDQTAIIQDTLQNVITKANEMLEKYGLYFRLNHNASKMRLLPFEVNNE